jgi:tripartite-type tricarboxylate transporter receptor subunit TctC
MKRVLAIVLFVSFQACAQSYPSKSVKVVSAFGPGNPADTLLRVVTQKMGEAMGQSFVVDPNTVASGVGAAQTVMRAAPDGHTLLYVLPSMIMIPPFLLRQKPFDPLKDFTPVMGIAESPVVIMAAASFPARSVKEMVELARANPGKLAYGTNGIGGTYHLQMELLKLQFGGIDMVQVPYKTTNEGIQALLSGQIPLVFSPVAAVTPHVRTGKVRMFALLDYKRLPDLPDVPALGEEVPNYVRIPAGVYLYGPAGLPPALARRLHSEAVKVLYAPDVAAKVKDLSYLPLGTPPDEVASRQVGVLDVIARAVKAAGLEPQ